MTLIVVITLFIAVALGDSFPVIGAVEAIPPAWRVAASVGGLAVLSAALFALMRLCARGLDRRGGLASAALADRALAFGQISVAVVHFVNVALLGELRAISGLVGDHILIDEMLCIAPALVALAVLWAGHAPVDRRISEAIFLRSLDEERTPYAPLNTLQHVLMHVRHEVAIVGIPALLLMAWTESVDRLAGAAWGVTPDQPDWRSMGLYALGAIAVFVLAPLLMVRVWSTSGMEDSPLRAALRAMCERYRVRLRGVRVWHTRGSMINGAVLGVLPASRYILLTDALLESMPKEQVEAVMAHEIAHVRHRHLHWLGAAAISCFVLSTFVVLQAASWAMGGGLIGSEPSVMPELAAWTGMAAALAATVSVFGYISRRFERQADAFAASHLSALTPPDEATTEAPVMTRSASRVMIETLGSVATLNQIPRTRFSLRHGSIAQRQEQLEDAIGRPLDRLPIDREVGMIKAAIALASVLAVLLMIPPL